MPERIHVLALIITGCLCVLGCASSGQQSAETDPAEEAPAEKAPDAEALVFRYDPERGVCVNARGEEGYNARTLEVIMETQDGDCTDLEGLDLFEALGPSGGTFAGVSFRGANLRGTGFPPYGAPNGAALHGADLRGARDIYGMPLQGEIDIHTTYDPDACEVTEEGDAMMILCQSP